MDKRDVAKSIAEGTRAILYTPTKGWDELGQGIQEAIDGGVRPGPAWRLRRAARHRCDPRSSAR